MKKLINFGSLNIDYTFRVEEIARAGQTISSRDERCLPGGKGLNQSLAAARAGAAVFHAGMIGTDGLFLKALLESEGVDCRFLRTVDCGTGKAFIQVDRAGRNCIVLSGGANQRNTREHCDEALRFFSPGDILLLQNEVNCLAYLIDSAYEKGLSVVLNPSPMDRRVLDCDLTKVSVFMLNEEEGRALTACANESDVLLEMERRYPRAEVVLTLGERGACYARGGTRLFQSSFPARAVDTTGAGDTFTGYFLADVLRGEPVERCLAHAARAAALSVSRPGAAASIPRRAEVAGDRKDPAAAPG